MAPNKGAATVAGATDPGQPISMLVAVEIKLHFRRAFYRKLCTKEMMAVLDAEKAYYVYSVAARLLQG